MILTVTPNPSLDRTADLPGPIVRGEVMRTQNPTVVAAGKGVNISRALTHASVPNLAVVPSAADDPLVTGLGRDGIAHRAVPVASPVRTNLTVTEPDGTTTKFNSPGARLGPQEAEALTAAVLAEAEQAEWVVLSGSLPPGLDDDWYARMVTALRAHGPRVAVDTSDAPLRALADCLPGCAPDLVKPNSRELAQLCGADPVELEEAASRGDHAQIVDAARQLRGIDEVLVTLGGAGALLVTADHAWHALPAPVTVRSTVGAGDSSLAGYLMARSRGEGPASCLSAAVAWGSAAAALPGSTLPTPDQADVIDVSLTTL